MAKPIGQESASTEVRSPLLHRREDAALRLGISLRMVDELIATRKLPSLKIGKRRLISETALAAFIRKHEQAARS